MIIEPSPDRPLVTGSVEITWDSGLIVTSGPRPRERDQRDAVGWLVDASHLLPLVPRDIPKAMVRNHRSEVRQWRQSGLRGVRTFRTEVLVDKFPSADEYGVMHANGEIDWHTDEGFPPYSLLLVIRPGGRCVTGKLDWRGDDRQPAGTLLCLRSHALHTLVDRGAPRQPDNDGPDVYYDKAPARPWVALCHDRYQEPTAEEGLAWFEEQLKRAPNA